MGLGYYSSVAECVPGLMNEWSEYSAGGETQVHP